MALASSTTTRFLDLPPSCIEICSWDNRYFAIGTYYLENKDEHQVASDDVSSEGQTRSGSILLFRLAAAGCDSIELVHTCPTDYAILDLHFYRIGDQKCIWTANSTGSLACYTIAETDFKVKESFVSQLWDQDVLVLSFTFHPTNKKLLGATLSDGSVVVCSLSEDQTTVTPVEAITKHDLEAWIMSFDAIGEQCLSGGDDAVLRCTAISGLSSFSDDFATAELLQPVPVWKNRRLHSAGVTAILPLGSDVILTGSYDDHLRVITLGKPPKLLAEENLGGGVWRLKLIHTSVNEHASKLDILASCMHAGVRIVRITLNTETPNSAEIEVLARFEEHESMNYGSDFVRNGYDYAILSTSFYDKRLCLWKVQTEAFGSDYKSVEIPLNARQN